MEIHGLCIIKDEADVIESCLIAALSWCDHIYVLDNGSTDGSWDLIQEIAGRHSQIVAFKQDDRVFSDSIRCDIFNAFRSMAKPGDWWCRLDADEFYVDDPRIFLAKVPARYGVVATVSITYYFSDLDAEAYQRNPREYLALPLERRIRHYLAHWSEPRFFRHRDDIIWTSEHGGFPASVQRASVYPVRIWLKHFQYRSPEQIECRLRARWPAIRTGSFRHEAIANWGDAVASIRTSRAGFSGARPEYASHRWQDRIVPAAALDFDGLDNRYVVDEALLPPLEASVSWPSVLRGLLPAALRRAIKNRMSRLRLHSGLRGARDAL
jgi:hypothetical protein